MDDGEEGQKKSKSKLFVLALLIVLGLCLNVVQKWETLQQQEVSYPDFWNNVQKIWVPTVAEKLDLNKYVELKFGKRKRHLNKICRNRNQRNFSVLKPQLIFAPERHVAVCFVQKSGSTSWNRLIWGLRHNLSYVDRETELESGYRNKNLAVMRDFTLQKKKKTLTSSIAIILVRHPFARLISGWSNKLHRKFVATHDNRLLKKMPEISSFIMSSNESSEYLMTFVQFLNFLVHLSENKTFDEWVTKLDSHFRPASSLCSPCLFDYDYIVKAESAPNDLWWVLDKINTSMTSFISQSDVTPVAWQPRTSSDLGQYVLKSKNNEIKLQETLMNYFKNVPVNVITKLKELYKSDFENFEYDFNSSTLIAEGLT